MLPVSTYMLLHIYYLLPGKEYEYRESAEVLACMTPAAFSQGTTTHLLSLPSQTYYDHHSGNILM